MYINYEDRFKNHLGVIHQIKTSELNKPELKEKVKAVIYKNHQQDLLWLNKIYGINFLNDSYKEVSKKEFPKFAKEVSVRDVFEVPDEQLVEKFESQVIDLLLKKLVQRA